jgi:hypothetical protein
MACRPEGRPASVPLRHTHGAGGSDRPSSVSPRLARAWAKLLRHLRQHSGGLLPGPLLRRPREAHRHCAPAGEGSEQTVYGILQDRVVVAKLGGFAERLVDNRVERDDAADELAPDRASDRGNATLLLSPRSSRLGPGNRRGVRCLCQRQCHKTGRPRVHRFPRPRLRDTPLDLLFSQGPGSSHAKAARSHRDQDAADSRH